MIRIGIGMADLPIMCSLTPEALRARREGLLSRLMQRADACEELPDGLRLRFPASGETLQLLVAAIDAERQCCRFLQFRVDIEADGGPVFFQLTGPPGTRDFLSALLS